MRKTLISLAFVFALQSLASCATHTTSITDSSGREYYTPPAPWYDKTWNPYDPYRSKQATDQYWEKYKEDHKYDINRYITIYDRDWRSIGYIKIND